MFVALTVICILGGWTGYQLNWILERRAIAADHDAVHFFGDQTPAPFPLWLFGEQGETGILIHTDSPRTCERIRRLYPEAVMVRADWDQSEPQ